MTKKLVCPCCNAPIDEAPTDWTQAMPRELFDTHPSQRPKYWRISPGGDICSRFVDGTTRRWFLRGVLFVPIRNTDRRMGFGLWAEVSKTDLDLIADLWDRSGADVSTTWPGVLNATRVPMYPEMETLSVEIQLDVDPNRRPNFIADSGTQVRAEQDAGIDVETWHRYNALMAAAP